LLLNLHLLVAMAGQYERSFRSFGEWQRLLALACVGLTSPGHLPVLMAQQAQTQAPPQAEEQKPKLKTADQLDSLVAPIALYPDPLLAQVLAATTYPLEIVQAQRWLKSNTTLKGEELTKAAAKQPWDPSVQALVAFPSALKLLDENIQWTTDLGNAFLDQQTDVMDAVQRMRKKAKDNGKLESSKEQKVETKTVESKTVVVIQPADPQVIYVPTYQPTVVYGPPVYAYPPVVYPSTGAVVATAAISFGVGVAMGAFWSGCCHGGYGWGCGWGGNNNITINNNFNNRYGYANVNGGNRVNNVNGGNRVAAGNGNNSWQHNPSHRRSVPYGNRNTAQQFGGTARDSAGRTERFDGGGQSRPAQTDRGQDRGSQAGNRDASSRGDRSQQSGARDGAAGQDRIGNRSIGSDSGRDSAFGGADSRSRTTAASDRGFSSTRESGGSLSGGGSAGARSGRSSSGGGGASRGGGGRRR
jgi:hypothetical protein